MSAFYHSFSVLSNACMLTIPTPQDEFVMQTDASMLGVGVVLSVIRNGEALLVSFYARQTRGAEKSYSATELESLGIVGAVEHFSHYLYANCFKLFTDHKSLCSLLSSKVLNQRLQGWPSSVNHGHMKFATDPDIRMLTPMDFQDKSGAAMLRCNLKYFPLTPLHTLLVLHIYIYLTSSRLHAT